MGLIRRRGVYELWHLRREFYCTVATFVAWVGFAELFITVAVRVACAGLEGIHFISHFLLALLTARWVAKHALKKFIVLTSCVLIWLSCLLIGINLLAEKRQNIVGLFVLLAFIRVGGLLRVGDWWEQLECWPVYGGILADGPNLLFFRRLHLFLFILIGNTVDVGFFGQSCLAVDLGVVPILQLVARPVRHELGDGCPALSMLLH